MGLIDRYIIRAIATPLILALCVAGMLLLLEQMLRLFDFVIAEQGPVDVVWRMLANLLPHYLGLALPVGTFLGIMLAFRNLALSSELDALLSSGVSFFRLMRPVYLLVAALMAIDFALVAFIQPYAQYKYEQIRFDVTSGALGIKIPQGEFVDITNDVTIRLGRIDTETKSAEDIYLEQRRDNGARVLITATRGVISTTPDVKQLRLELGEGRRVFLDEPNQRVNALGFDTFDIEVALPGIDVFRERGGDDREATLGEIVNVVFNGTRTTSPLWDSYRAGLHWRIIHPLTFLVMPILAIATGVTGRRRTSNLKPIIGMAVLIVYHEVLEEWGKVVAGAGEVSPYVSMWGVFAVFLAVSIYLYRQSIDQSRTARLTARNEVPPVRIVTDPSPLDEAEPRAAILHAKAES